MQRVVFLDRDGVINKPPADGEWVLSWDGFEFDDGVLDALGGDLDSDAQRRASHVFLW